MRLLNISISVVLLVAVQVMFAPRADAWGKFGHLTVCDLAYRNLTPTSRDALNDLLQSKSGGTLVRGKGKMADRHYTSFNVGCLEEDELPRAHPDDHFINVGRSVASIGSTCPANGSCILEGIRRDIGILGDRSKSREDRVRALMALGHWVGDIHQPLHVSFKDDKGGNYILVNRPRCGTSGYRPENLHAVWDNCLLEAGLFQRVRDRSDFSKGWSKNTITYRAVDTIQANTSLAEERAIIAGGPQAWANESYRITLQPDVLYCVRVGSTCRYSPSVETLPAKKDARTQDVTPAYISGFERVAQERVTKAGFRLAHLINKALDPAYTQPVRDSTQRP